MKPFGELARAELDAAAAAKVLARMEHYAGAFRQLVAAEQRKGLTPESGEIGAVAATFNELLETLQHTVIQVSDAATQVAT